MSCGEGRRRVQSFAYQGNVNAGLVADVPAEMHLEPEPLGANRRIATVPGTEKPRIAVW